MASPGKSARNKGAAFEREVAKILSDATGVEWKRGLGQTRGGGSERADVYTEDLVGSLFHVECKNQKICNIKGAMKQALGDIKGTNKVPVVITKDTRQETLVTMRLEDWLPLFNHWLGTR